MVAAWLNFYVLAQTLPAARRLLRVYQRRLQANLVHELRGMGDEHPAEVARGIGAMIDGFYIREALSDGPPAGRAAAAMVLAYIDATREGQAT